MAQNSIAKVKTIIRTIPERQKAFRLRLRSTPWWLVAMLLIALITVVSIITNQDFNQAFQFIFAGLGVTISTTFLAFVFALGLGLLTALGRLSKNVFLNNLATFYVEFIRGVPMLVLIFFIAYVGVPAIVDACKNFGIWLVSLGVVNLGIWLSGFENSAVPMNTRAVIALATTYGAFLAEIFRAGIQSINSGQMEAARSQGMSYPQAMRYIILPQAIRNILPALGNDFISMLKDTSLVSILAVRDITQIAKLYAGRTFQYEQSYITLAVMYLTMTVLLSFLLKFIEKRIGKNEQR